MEGVTTALVLFIFACVAFPKMVRNKPQFYIGIALTAAIIVLDAVGFMVRNAGETNRPGALGTFLYVIVALCQFLAFVALILGSGGLSMKELADDMAGAFEAVREGEDKSVIVPSLRGRTRRDGGDEEERVVYTINSPESPAAATPRPGATDPIPFDEEDVVPPTAPPPAPPPTTAPQPPPGERPPGTGPTV